MILFQLQDEIDSLRKQLRKKEFELAEVSGYVHVQVVHLNGNFHPRVHMCNTIKAFGPGSTYMYM